MKDIGGKLDRLLRTKFFIAPTAQIYGGVSGLYDYGPLGVRLKNNMVKLWREFFVDEEEMLEIDASILTPFEVLKASGHVDKFSDKLLFDQVNGECYRADHFLEQELEKLLNLEHINPKNDQKAQKPVSQSEKVDIKGILNNLDSLSCHDIDKICAKYNFKSVHNNNVSGCSEFNLMFSTNIGPKAQCKAFLRPETAQSQFVNSKKLCELNGDKLPFATASIGKVFRNEISPRNGLLRVREFEQAEIEHFVFPDNKTCSKFNSVAYLELNLLFSKDSNEQTVQRLTLKDAVDRKIIDNETLAYFIGRTFQFLLLLGIKEKKLRFRQHKKDEMAHYACDCWDAEIQTSAGWIECVGIADRSCFDLNMHEKNSGADLKVRRKLDTPKEVLEYKMDYDKQALGKKLRSKLKEFENNIQQISQAEITEKLQGKETGTIDFDFEGENYPVKISSEKKQVFVEEITPNVIEPSFGIGRIFYSILEHNFWIRPDDEQRQVLSLLPKLAPFQCIVTSVRNGSEFDPIIKKILFMLKKHKISAKQCERNVSIGKKYSTYDEIGTPFIVTVDQDSLTDHQATIRERDTTKQIRRKVDEIAQIVHDLCESIHQWPSYGS